MTVNKQDNPERKAQKGRQGESGTNSVVFEGAVQNEPAVTGKGEGRRCSFVLSAWRNYYLENGECVRRKEGASIRVVARGTELVEAAVSMPMPGARYALWGGLPTTEGCTLRPIISCAAGRPRGDSTLSGFLGFRLCGGLPGLRRGFRSGFRTRPSSR
ncbi:MAG: hypothetical protein LBF77_00095, partial [Spirochaetaceae bacterium]|nr:hypothetical protein [Spirochaetaceae bacterium]